MVDLETGTARGLGRIGTEGRSPVWWQAYGSWHLAYLAMAEPFGGDAVYDVVVSAAAAVHRDLTEGMAVCPTELAQVTGGPPLALFADGLDTAIYRLDPDLLRFGCVAALDGLAESLTACGSGSVIAALASTSYEPANVHAGPPAGPLIRLSDTRPELRAIRWGSQERLSYRASDGLGLDGLLVLPPGRNRADGPFPLITWCTAALITGMPTSSCSPRTLRDSGSRLRGTPCSCPTRGAGWVTAVTSRRRSRARSGAPSGATLPAGSTC